MPSAVDIIFPSRPLGFTNTVDSIADLRSKDPTNADDDTNVLVPGTGYYVWNSVSVATDDGVSVVKPDDRTILQAGRWLIAQVGIPGVTGDIIEAVAEAEGFANDAEGFADDAEAQKIAAAVSATASAASATQAGLSASAAQLAMPIYPDIATGRAAVADNALFSVAGTGNTYVSLYKRLTSSTQTLLGQYPSLAAVSFIMGVLTNGPDVSGYAKADLDSYGMLAGGIKNDGSYYLASARVDTLDVGSISGAVGTETIFPNDPRLTRDGYLYTVQDDAYGFQPRRPYTADSGPGSTQQHLTPGTRFAWVSRSTSVSVTAVFDGTVNGVVADTQAPVPYLMSILVNGGAAGSLTSSSTGTGEVVVTGSAAGLGSAPKLIEVLWPYGRPVRLSYIEQSAGGGVSAAGTPAYRMVGQIDSITHGRTVSRPELSWFISAARTGALEPIDLGVSGRQLTAADGTLAGSVARVKVATCMSGANEWQNGQYSPTVFGTIVTGWLNNFFAVAPSNAGVQMISQPWCSGEATANGLGFTPPNYRSAFQAAVMAHPLYGTRVLFKDGLTVMTNNINRTVDGLHPNDLGSGEIAAAVASQIATLKAL